MRKVPAVLAASLLIAPLMAKADESNLALLPGEGIEETSANCAVCHSLDYIKMNSPFLTADGWKAEVTKMRKAFGANIDEDVASKITAYLASQYGPTG